jgi:hypothetical protein
LNMQNYKKRNNPNAAVIEAVKLTKENVDEVAEWCTGKEVEEIDGLNPEIRYVGLNFIAWDGVTRASEGDYIVKDAIGEFHLRWADNFERDFEKVGNDADSTT